MKEKELNRENEKWKGIGQTIILSERENEHET